MTIIGDELNSPEIGWIRYEDTDHNISYVGQQFINDFGCHYVINMNENDSIRFNFIGSKLRLLGRRSNDRGKNTIIIDGIEVGQFSQVDKVTKSCALDFEISGLEFKEHSVEIYGSGRYYFNAVDIDDNGSLRPYSNSNNVSIINPKLSNNYVYKSKHPIVIFNADIHSIEKQEVKFNILSDNEETIILSDQISIPSNFNIEIPTKNLKIGINKMTLNLEKNGVIILIYKFKLNVENRDSFIIERELNYEEDYILSENSSINYKKGLSLKSVGYGSLEIPIPTEGKAKVKQVLIDGGIELQPVIPIMTSNNQGGFIASSSGINGSSYQPFKAFNSGFGSNDKWESNRSFPVWLQIENQYTFVVNEYGLYGSYNTSYDPKSWELQGSNDGVNWKTLDIRNDEPRPVTGVEVRYIPKLFNNYKMYRLFIIASHGASYCSVGRLQLYTWAGFGEELVLTIKGNEYIKSEEGSIYKTKLNSDYRTIVGLRG